MFVRTSLLVAALGIFLAACSSPDDHDHSTHGMEGQHTGNGDGGASAANGEMNALCPVMGEEVDPAVFTEYRGRKVYFCCDSCRADFDKDPDHYFAKAYPAATGG